MKVVLKLNQAGKYDYKSYDSIGNLRVIGQKIGTKDGSQFIGWVNFYKNDSILQEEALVIGEELIVNQRKMYAKSELVRDSSTYFYYDNGSLNLNIEKKYVYPAPGLSFSKDITSDFSNLNNSGDTLAPNQINKEENYFSWDI